MASRLPPDPLLDILTRPREAGTPAAVAARTAVAERLTALGFEVEYHLFRFQPSTLWAFPLLGAGFGWLGLVLAPLLALAGVPAWAALGAWLVGAASLAAFASGVASGATSLPFGGPPRDDANLLATRSSEIRRWIVAHLDTKAQGQSMAGRLITVWVMATATTGLTGLTLARLSGPLPVPWALAGVGIALGTAVLAGRGRLAGQSPGARDNGSGVVAALAAAEATADPTVGVVITGAEEFGLLGARALTRDRPRLFEGKEVVNLDTLDEAGALYVVTHDPRGDAAVARLQPVLAESGNEDMGWGAIAVRRRRLPLGILVDSLPFARAGAVAVTIARLNWATLRHIHTARDTGDGLSFDTATWVGRSLARMN